MPERSRTIGVTCALVAGFGSWLQLDVGGFTVQSVDLLWLALFTTAVSMLTVQRVAVPWRVWSHPIAATTFTPFLLALVLAPMLGVIFNGVPGEALSSSARFLLLASFPLVFHVLKLDYRQVLQGFTIGVAIAVIGNVAYAALQLLEFNGAISFGTLPHHRLAEFISGSRFDDWGRASGFFLSGNHLGYFGLFAVILFLARFLDKPAVGLALLTIAALSLAVMGNSRSAVFLAAAVVVLMPIAWAAIRKRIHLQLAGIIGVIALLVGVVVVAVYSSEQARDALNIDRYVRIVRVLVSGDVSADNSLRTRVDELWPATMAALNDYPLGFGAEPSVYLTGTIDSAWLTYLVQGSALMVVLYLVFILGTAFVGIEAVASRDRYRRVSGFSLAALIIGLALGSFLLSPLHVPSMFLLFLVTYQIAIGHCSGVHADAGN